MHLAQANVATLRYGPDDPRLVGFSLGASMIRRAAANAPGHVWNEQTHDETSRFSTRSVWESFDALREFVYSGIHERYMRRSAEWFVPASGHHLVLWWVQVGETPTMDEALGRLEAIRERGPSRNAFDFDHPFLFVQGVRDSGDPG